MLQFSKITVGVDMAGCPNRCRHCWLGVTENKGVSIEQLREIANDFREHAEHFEILSWYREPDFRGDYKSLWELEKQLSTEKTPHFELAGFWRLVRDETYAKWLYENHVRKIQLTLFGDEDTTDYYVGRKGAYQEIIRAITILLNNGIAPRIQVFVNQGNLSKLQDIVRLCNDLELEQRCGLLGQKFELFAHAGSCDGENEKLYDIRMEPEDLSKIPDDIVRHTLDYLKKRSIEEVFGFSEKYLCSEFKDWDKKFYAKSNSPVFYVDSSLNVYPNVTSPYPWWKIGNLMNHGCETILKRYAEDDFFAAREMRAKKFEDMLDAYGNKDSGKLFGVGDYFYYIWNKYLREKYDS